MRDKARYQEYLEAELEAAAVYRVLADAEEDEGRREIFEELRASEMKHAGRWAEKLGMSAAEVEPRASAMKLRSYALAARLFGTKRVVPWLVRFEAKEIAAYAADPEAVDLVEEERRHSRVLSALASGDDPLAGIRPATEAGIGGGGRLRAAVLGMNDGLVSNFSLVMGVVGGTGNHEFVLLAGTAGLLAGAFSMAAGEYISMRSQRDTYEHRIRMEKAELEEWPEEEEEELVLIYRAKGLPEPEARSVAKQIMSRPDVALETMAREELGLDPSQLGAPWGAAISSFLSFLAGAALPIIPFLFDAGSGSVVASAVVGGLALVVVGGVLATVSGRNVAWGALRMFLAGGLAATVTFGVGRLIGVSMGL